MPTTQYPHPKTVQWVLGIAAYGLAATGLTVWWSQSVQAMWLPWDKLLPNVFWGGKFAWSYVASSVMIAPWTLLLAAGALLMVLLRHRTAGRALAVMTVVAVLVSLYIVTWTVMDKWWLGYVGIGNPAPPIEKCDFTPQACDSYYATATAEAPRPPWLP